jgi:glycosyltransferase involved in cell wall biosynthesis
MTLADRLIRRVRAWSRTHPGADEAAAPIARVAINSWGGGNQWVQQIARYLTGRGWAVRFDLSGPVDAIVMVDPRVGGAVAFGPDEIRAYKLRFPGARCLHRVNECDQRKGTDVMDALLADANKVADVTVFVSAWLRDYHTQRWFDPAAPHAVIGNGADPSIFHPLGGAVFAPGMPLRLVTHHWSDNWMKGFAVYETVDGLIADGRLRETELHVIGRWPAKIGWRAARTFAPARGVALAALLRQCHVYLTASRWDPGPMHTVEAAQCGLPIVYHADGGGLVESAARYGVAFRDDVGAAIEEARTRYAALRADVLRHAPSGDRMCVDYAGELQRLCVGPRSR